MVSILDHIADPADSTYTCATPCYSLFQNSAGSKWYWVTQNADTFILYQQDSMDTGLSTANPILSVNNTNDASKTWGKYPCVREFGNVIYVCYSFGGATQNYVEEQFYSGGWTKYTYNTTDLHEVKNFYTVGSNIYVHTCTGSGRYNWFLDLSTSYYATHDHGAGSVLSSGCNVQMSAVKLYHYASQNGATLTIWTQSYPASGGDSSTTASTYTLPHSDGAAHPESCAYYKDTYTGAQIYINGKYLYYYDKTTATFKEAPYSVAYDDNSTPAFLWDSYYPMHANYVSFQDRIYRIFKSGGIAKVFEAPQTAGTLIQSMAGWFPYYNWDVSGGSSILNMFEYTDLALSSPMCNYGKGGTPTLKFVDEVDTFFGGFLYEFYDSNDTLFFQGFLDLTENKSNHTFRSVIAADLAQPVKYAPSASTVAAIVETLISTYCMFLQAGTFTSSATTYTIKCDGKLADVLTTLEKLDTYVWSYNPTALTISLSAGTTSSSKAYTSTDSKLMDIGVNTKAYSISKVVLHNGVDAPVIRIKADADVTGRMLVDCVAGATTTELGIIGDNIIDKNNIEVAEIELDTIGDFLAELGKTIEVTWELEGFVAKTFYTQSMRYDPSTLHCFIRAVDALIFDYQPDPVKLTATEVVSATLAKANYLPLAGGTMTGDLLMQPASDLDQSITFKRTAGTYGVRLFRDKAAGALKMQVRDSGDANWVTLITLSEGVSYATIADFVDSQSWIAVSGGVGFSNSWEDYAPNGWEQAAYKKVGNRVWIRGLVKSGSPANSTIFTLPTGYRPPENLMFAVCGAGSFCQLYVQANGAVVTIVGGSATYTSINCSFTVD